MVYVYKFPPLAAVAKEWTVIDPVGKSVDMITGATKISGVQRRRRIMSLDVSSRFSQNSNGGGYVEALKRLLKGGINLVEIGYSRRIYEDEVLSKFQRGRYLINWSEPPLVEWSEPPTVLWYKGAALTYTETTWGDGFPAIVVSGLPVHSLIALSGEFLTLVSPSDETITQTLMVINRVMSNASGQATVYLETAPTIGGARVQFGTEDVGVFALDEMPRSKEPNGTDWFYSFNMTEVYEDERGEFEKVNPWN